MKILYKIHILIVIGLMTTVVNAAKPIGYERWTEDPWTFVDHGLTCEFAKNQYNDPNFLIFDDKLKTGPNYRLIDIEARPDSHTGEIVFDVIAYNNTGDHKRHSWLLCDMKDKYFKFLVNQEDTNLVFVDVERYVRNGQIYWAGIAQYSPVKLDTWFIQDETIDDINLITSVNPNDQLWRVLDIDFSSFECTGRTAGGVACDVTPTYHAIVVENTGNNHIDWLLDDDGGALPPGFQLIDLELAYTQYFSNPVHDDVHHARLSVKSYNWSGIWHNIPANFNFLDHGIDGVVIDLEWEANDNDNKDDWTMVLLRE